MTVSDQTFRMKPEGVAPYAAMGRFFGWIIWGYAAFFLGSTLWASDPADLSRPTYVVLCFLIVLVPAGAVTLVQRRLVKIWLHNMASLEIVLGEDFILRRKENHPEMRIGRAEITHIFDLGQGGLIVRPGSRYKQILVPPGIEGYEEIRFRLFQWKHPEPATRQRLFMVTFFGGLLALVAAHLAPTWTSNSRLILVLHVAAAFGLLFGLFECQKSPQLSVLSKRLSWILLLLAASEALAAYGRLVAQ